MDKETLVYVDLDGVPHLMGQAQRIMQPILPAAY